MYYITFINSKNVRFTKHYEYVAYIKALNKYRHSIRIVIVSHGKEN